MAAGPPGVAGVEVGLQRGAELAAHREVPPGVEPFDHVDGVRHQLLVDHVGDLVGGHGPRVALGRDVRPSASRAPWP